MQRQRAERSAARAAAVAAFPAIILSPDGSRRNALTGRPPDRNATRAPSGRSARPAMNSTGDQYAACGNAPRQVGPRRARAYGVIPAEALPKKSCACTTASGSVAIGSCSAWWPKRHVARATVRFRIAIARRATARTGAAWYKPRREARAANGFVTLARAGAETRPDRSIRPEMGSGPIIAVPVRSVRVRPPVALSHGSTSNVYAPATGSTMVSDDALPPADTVAPHSCAPSGRSSRTDTVVYETALTSTATR